MNEDDRMEGKKGGGSVEGVWREIRSAIDDRILRACLPEDEDKIDLTAERLTITIDSRYKREYSLKKLEKLAEVVRRLIGEREIIIGEARSDGRPHPLHSDRPPARLLVVGIGDGGVNAVTRMQEESLYGVRLVAVDTDKQVLDASTVGEKLQLGAEITGGRGTGGDVDKGRKGALESRWEIARLVQGMDLVFVTAGLGGGTGTGAAPVIAEIAKEAGSLTVGVVTLPFSFEGETRRERAEEGLHQLRKAADVLIVVSNDRLLETSAKGMPMLRAFELADGILHQGVRGISDLITIRGLINLDFADIRNVLAGAGDAMMGMGEASGEGRAIAAAKIASTNPLLEGNSIRGARKLIMNVTGGRDLTLGEVTVAADQIRRATATESDLVFGAVVRDDLTGRIRITVIAADFHEGGTVGKEHRGQPRRERISTDEDLDLPTFLRRERKTGEGEKPD